MNHSLRARGEHRRGFLRRSGGALLALPWLESLPLRRVEAAPAGPAPSGPPLRFACIYFSNGVEPEHWWARGQGATMELGPGLAPLQPHREDLIFLRGLFNEQAARHPSAHLGRMPNLLSGAWVNTDQNLIRCGQSFDQLLAQRIGSATPVSSLVLGIEPTELRLEDGLSMIYGSCISWASATKPATKEIFPARVFDLLMNDGQRLANERSILDEVLADARDLRLQVSRDDQRKVDEYLESVRSIEQRIDRAQREGRLEGARPATPAAILPRPAAALPQDIPEHMKLMLDLIVLAFQLDKTRIATCMLNNDLSQMNFGFLEGVQGSLHLDLTHNGRKPELEAMYLKTNQFHLGQFAYLVQRLKGIREGDGTLLDHSILLGCSNLLDGDKHQATEMPMVLAGRGNGKLVTGRVLDYLERGDNHRRACSLYLALLHRFGVAEPRFGDSDSLLSDL